MSSSTSALLSRVPEAREHLSVSKKRKWDDTRPSAGLDGDIDRRPFVVRPPGNDPFARTRAFTPICVITRAQLPLAWLDTAGAGSQLFAADVRVLEACHDAGEEGKVLVAEEKDDGRLFAVERTARKVYALCRLGSWVARKALEGLAAMVPDSGSADLKRKAVADGEGVPWWSRAAVEAPLELEAETRAIGLLDMSLRTKAGGATSGTSASSGSKSAAVNQSALPATAVTESQTRHEPMLATAAQDPLEELSRQYLDALYLSRTSLAYFAKGPMSRARAVFTGMAGSETHVTDLTKFLRETALTSTIMDNKYRDTLPGLIRDLSAAAVEGNAKSIKSKRKKKWKAKRDKAGLFTNEPEYLDGWWHGSDMMSSLTSPETVDVAIKRRMPSLRSRETYLQIIVILETMVLEAANKADAAQQQATEETQDADTQDVESQAAATSRKSRSKKPQDLHSLLETLLDRLCIWHSLESHTPAKTLGNNGDATKEDSNDELRNFCIEVIVPFFISRLPKEAALVNKKLGGPSPPSPAKRKTTTLRSKPGEPAARRALPPERQARKPLSRVPTEVLDQPVAPAVPGLHRSATDSQIIKREDSAVAMSSIPAIQPQQFRKRRSDLLSSFSSSFGHREVDLDAKAAAAAAKLKKREEQDAQVRDAILAIKKPNRTLANKDVAARADERFARSLPGKRRPQLQQAQSLPAAVHVAATPKRGSRIIHAHSYSAATDHETVTHSSGHSMIPSTSIRYREQPRPYPSMQAISSTPAAVPQTSRRASRDAPADVEIEDTPFRARAVAEYPNLPAALTESPTAKRTSKVLFATPRKTPREATGVGETPNASFAKAAAAVQGTPMLDRLSAVHAAAGESIGGIERSEEGRGGSIYDSLGWDDEEYEELA